MTVPDYERQRQPQVANPEIAQAPPNAGGALLAARPRAEDPQPSAEAAGSTTGTMRVAPAVPGALVSTQGRADTAATTAIGADAAGQGVAVAVAQAQAQAQAQAVAARAAADAKTLQPPHGPGGSVYGRSPAEGAGRRGRRSIALPRLRVGYHLASEGALAALVAPDLPTGIILGQDRDQQMVSVRLFRREPTRITLIGGTWLTRLLLMRVLALGARIAIVASQPETWHGFGQWATGRDDRVVVTPIEAPPVLSGSSQEPILVVYDGDQLSAAALPALGPWQTQLTILSQLNAYSQPLVQESTVVLMQRLAPAEARIVASALILDDRSEYLIQALRDDMVAMIGGDIDRYVWIAPTSLEQQYLGAPKR
jgi:hypothetical protein